MLNAAVTSSLAVPNSRVATRLPHLSGRCGRYGRTAVDDRSDDLKLCVENLHARLGHLHYRSGDCEPCVENLHARLDILHWLDDGPGVL